MFKPAEMQRVDILVLGSHITEITEELGTLGLLHLLDVKRHRPELGMRGVDASEHLERLGRVIKSADNIKEALHVILPSEPPPVQMPMEEIERRLGNIEESVKKVVDGIQLASAEVDRLKDVMKEVETFKSINVDIKQLNDFSFLHFAVGSLAERGLKQFHERHGDTSAIVIPFVTSDGDEKVIAATTKKGRWSLEGELENVGFKKEDISEKYEGVPERILSEAERRLQKLDARIVALEQRRNNLRKRYGTFVAACRRRIEIEQKIVEAQERFGRTENTFLISGWVPTKDVDGLTRKMMEVTGGRAVIEVHEARTLKEVKEGKVAVPVLLSNPPFLKPFERLITTYGFPGYDEVEPTLFVAISFLIMFGLMFGDLGQGCVIALVGLLLRKLPATRERLADIGGIMFAAGISAAIFGVLYGSVFGSDHIIPALWANPLEDVVSFMKLGVFFGMALIGLGILLNIVNCVRKKDYLHGVFDKFGVVGGIFYAGCIGLAIKYLVLGQEKLSSGYLILFILLPLAILFFRVPLYNIIAQKPGLFHGNVGVYFMESLIELLETAVGFLANTVSFVRVSAFALSHVGLSIAVFAMADAMKGLTGGTVLSFLTIAVGNAIIILLEGLIVTVQTIRLEYYEFFSKFFGGGGEKFEPFTISK